MLNALKKTLQDYINQDKPIEQSIRDFIFEIKKLFLKTGDKLLFNIVKHETEDEISYTLIANKNYIATVYILIKAFGTPTYYTSKFFIWGDKISAECKKFSLLSPQEQKNVLDKYLKYGNTR